MLQDRGIWTGWLQTCAGRAAGSLHLGVIAGRVGLIEDLLTHVRAFVVLEIDQVHQPLKLFFREPERVFDFVLRGSLVVTRIEDENCLQVLVEARR